MSRVTSIRRPPVGYIETLLAEQPQLPTSPLMGVNQLRSKAVDHLATLTLPTKRDEAWRFTDISALTKLLFQPVRPVISLVNTDVEHFYL